MYRLGSRFRVNETFQISEHYKQKRLAMLDQMYLSIIEYSKHDWLSAFGHTILCYSRATDGTFILYLLFV